MPDVSMCLEVMNLRLGSKLKTFFESSGFVSSKALIAWESCLFQPSSLSSMPETTVSFRVISSSKCDATIRFSLFDVLNRSTILLMNPSKSLLKVAAASSAFMIVSNQSISMVVCLKSVTMASAR